MTQRQEPRTLDERVAAIEEQLRRTTQVATGGGGGGVSDHGALTGVTANQHHAQLHAADHAPAGTDSLDGTYATDAALAAHLATENADHGIEHSDLNTVTADQHHTQAHTHPAEGAVVVTHASTTGQTANDHHTQAHDIDGADHNGFPGGTTTFLRADGTFAAPGGGSGDITPALAMAWGGF